MTKLSVQHCLFCIHYVPYIEIESACKDCRNKCNFERVDDYKREIIEKYIRL